jgi:starch synthase
MANKKLSVLMATAELAPLAKVGGLGDVAGSLPKALIKLDANIKMIMPFYGAIDKKKFKAILVKRNISVEVDLKNAKFDLYKTKLPGSSIDIFLIKHKIFDGKVYIGKPKNRKIGDVERFVFFSKALVEAIKVMKWPIDLVHCHDWHTALVPTFIDEYSINDRNFSNIKTLLTIHNLSVQGKSSLDIVDYAGLHQDLTPALMEDYYDKDGNLITLIRIGILSADYINTVSPTYAKEILTKEYGADMENFLARRQKHLAGILNGIDIDFFNPQKDKFIKKKYNLKTVLKNKPANKKYLQAMSGLPTEDVPVLGLVSRLFDQKGLDILVPALKKTLKKYDFQLVVLGTGAPKYEKAFKALAKAHPDKVKANITFNVGLAQEIYGGSDFFLIPSRFEPCGLGQMIAMRYGTIPIARQTGGLKDTVTHNKTGIVFKKYTQKEMIKAIEQSLKLYKNKAKFAKIVKTDMKQDFSWDRSAKDYLKLYKKLK